MSEKFWKLSGFFNVGNREGFEQKIVVIELVGQPSLKPSMRICPNTKYPLRAFQCEVIAYLSVPNCMRSNIRREKNKFKNTGRGSKAVYKTTSKILFRSFFTFKNGYYGLFLAKLVKEPPVIRPKSVVITINVNISLKNVCNVPY